MISLIHNKTKKKSSDYGWRHLNRLDRFCGKWSWDGDLSTIKACRALFECNVSLEFSIPWHGQKLTLIPNFVNFQRERTHSEYLRPPVWSQRLGSKLLRKGSRSLCQSLGLGLGVRPNLAVRGQNLGHIGLDLKLDDFDLLSKVGIWIIETSFWPRDDRIWLGTVTYLIFHKSLFNLNI